MRVAPAPGAWPAASAGDRTRLASLLAAVPAGQLALLDGLVACAAPEVLEAHARRVRLVVLVHLPLGDETGLDDARARTVRDAERRALRAAAGVIATSGATARRLSREAAAAGSPRRVFVAVPGAVPAAVAPGSAGGCRLLCVASVTPRKGQDVLVEALSRLADLPWTLTCAGPLDRAPEYAAEVRRAASALGDRVVFAGPVTGGALDALYDGADLVVLPSRAEPYGMVVTEALARGIPVVVSDLAGPREAVGAAAGGVRPGLVAPAGDAAALAGALRRWLTEPALRERLRRAALARRRSLPRWPATVAAVAAALDAMERAA